VPDTSKAIYKSHYNRSIHFEKKEREGGCGRLSRRKIVEIELAEWADYVY
jgi:hypothetical protein